uniref:hypothetical protein n=1 Tax=Nocardioides sp. TaxID=35761 RepID=UPI00286DD854
VSSLVGGERGLWSTTSDGASYALWHSPDGGEWTTVNLPASAPEGGGERILTGAADVVTVLLLADDGTGGRLWWSAE